MALSRGSLRERLNRKIKVDLVTGCHVWTGKLHHAQGYGYITTEYDPITRKSKLSLAHRVSWQLQYGPIPDGIKVCHVCDNPPCVNPDHLFLGTQKDNIDDMCRKARHGGAKLTADTVREIRRTYTPRKGNCLNKLANKFGVSQALIGQVVSGKIWKHVI